MKRVFFFLKERERERGSDQCEVLCGHVAICRKEEGILVHSALHRQKSAFYSKKNFNKGDTHLCPRLFYYFEQQNQKRGKYKYRKYLMALKTYITTPIGHTSSTHATPPPIFEERVYPFSSTHAKLEEVYMSVFIIIIFFIGVCVCVLVGQRVSVREMYFLSYCCYLFLGELKSNGQAHAPPLFCV